MPYGTLVLSDGEEVLFELDEAYVGPVSDEGVVQGLRESFERVMRVVQHTAEGIHVSINQISNTVRPNSYEVTFGVKLSAVAGVVFAKAGTEGTFQIKLTWKGDE
jgi:hypothetical protein